MVQEKYLTTEAMYARIKEEVRQRALALDEAVSQSTQVCFSLRTKKLQFCVRVYHSSLGKAGSEIYFCTVAYN